MFKFRFSLGQVKIVCGALAVLLSSALAVSNLHAQVTTAVLSGTALDTTGAVVVGAKIQATDVGTGISYTGTTDGAGRYTLPEMPIGTYNVSAQKTGFQKMVQTGIVLTVGAHPVLDFKLKVGRTEEEVQVHGQASSVDTTTAAVGQLVSPVQMADLPLNGRNFTDLLTLAPGVATVPMVGGGGGKGATAYGTQTNYSVSGSRPIGLQYLLDGTDIRGAQDHGAGVTITATSLGMDAIQEFTVLTNTYGAQFGGTGAAINAVSKSGTNTVHGSAYEFIRNSVLDAMNYFDVPGVKPPYKRNQFGGTLGGPIKKDKAFYFFNYEGLRSGQGQTERAVVPISLTALAEANGMTPAGTGFAGPYGEMPLLIQQIFETYPTAPNPNPQCPNVTNVILEPGEGLLCSLGTLIQNEDYGLARVDYTIGPKDSVFARFNIESAFQSVPYSTNILPAAIPGYPEIDNEQNQYTTIEERHVFSPKVLNEARFGFVRLHAWTANGGLNGQNALYQVSGSSTSMDFSPGGGLTEIGPVPSNPSQDVMNRFSEGDDVTMTLGAHTLHFGATFTRVQTNDYWNDYSGGFWIFANLSSGVGGGLGGALYGNPLVAINGAAPSYSYPAPSGINYPFNPEHGWRQNLLEPYIQDDWKINKRLTINLGVRYEWASNPTTSNGSNFILPGQTTIGKTSILLPTVTESSFINTTHVFYSNPNVKDIDPRIGLAYDPFADHKTSIRAGFAMYHEPVESRTYAFESPFPTAPWFEPFFPSTFPNLATSFDQVVSVLGTTASQTIAWFNGLLPTVDTAPYMMQYNLTVQRQLWPGTLFNIGYNGSSGVHFFASIDANPPQSLSMLSASDQEAAKASGNYTLPGGGEPTGAGEPGTLNNPFQGTHVDPNLAGYMAVEPFAHSSYNSLQTSLTRQFSGSLAGNAAYTWSRCLTNASAMEGNEQGEYAINDPYNPSLDRGPCSFNSNQVFSLNAIYGLPFHGSRALNGWQISPIFSYSKGLPINVQEGTFMYQSNISGLTEGERPAVVPGCKPMVRKVSEWYNPECYVLQPYGTIGNSSENSLNNPNYFDWDFAVMKQTKLTEKLSVQLRAEFFDIVNHPNMSFGNQAVNWSTSTALPASSPNYSQISNPAAYRLPTADSAGGILCNPSGKSTTDGGAATGVCYTTSTALTTDQLGTLGDQRQIQFAVRLMF